MQKLIEATVFHHDHVWLAKHGDRCWEYICSAAEIEKPFAVHEIADGWANENGISVQRASQQISLVLRNVEAEDRGAVIHCGRNWRFPKGVDA